MLGVGGVASLGGAFIQGNLRWLAAAFAVEKLVYVVVWGLWMIGNVARQAAQSGARFAMPLDWTIMATLGIVMMAIFGHIRFALFRRLQRAVAASDWPAGGQAMAAIRQWVAVNLGLGVAIVAITLLL